MLSILNHFRSHVLKGTAKSGSSLTITAFDTPAKVTDLENIVIRNKQVFRLDISMNKTVFMKKVDPCASLNKKVESFIFIKFLFVPY